ncbi:RdgB/HAM1 family non-canonical purine NTP pyrophosphatase [Thiothrix subterranea]|uniref:dITP/XTP pyrophosphatase n=1 Tax=Thiothrix subterranea TaxID=2735563 RepID=A0AA51QYK5_9GAMM|nr:RdgB/HAM1 family non-canonical purine NTP pyrophosphatase [Thiothrix subterranea]MDQ5769096.1 RdgB/HAM1 family non-canonical purine NTP pyrophosphatase [Thiothrix subterranea]WML88343.1 RdgB/HAM1 family non-canonical purine NTP pyrophosphatase [Thiothrix subterranea]
MSQRIVLASGNAGKLREFNAMLADLGIEFVRQSEFGVQDADETGLTFVENALIKARNAAQHTGMPAMADDSGIVVDALGGAPGLYSARYAGEHGDDAANNAKLLEALQDVPDAQRTARFYCCIVYLRHAEDQLPIIAEASWEGRILHSLSGANGFGYDPLFYVPTHDCSSAELPAEEKNRISHRGQALRKLHEMLLENAG